MSRTAGAQHTDGSHARDPHGDLPAEQHHLTRLYQHLDALRDRAAERLAGVLRDGHAGTPQSRSERDATAGRYQEELTRLDAVEQGLCFGRLDFTGEPVRYIGRIGLFDERNDYQPLLIDWRAPAARPFYLATAAAPGGVRRRRHIHTRQREVTGLADEVLDLAGGTDRPSDLTGEAALLAAITAARTGQLRDIVATIQAEQDRIIRAPLDGLLVVQGGPGTGKTAVALHRAAYLLYAHRDRLSRQAVLVVGPNATFLRYIGQVLPALAETGVVLRTLGDLYPGVAAHRAESPAAAELKGQLAMVEVLRRAVRDRQRVPDEPIRIELADTHAGLNYEPEVLLLSPESCARARQAGRRSGRPHNLARDAVRAAVIDELAQQLAERIGADPYATDPLGGADAPGAGALVLSSADVAEISAELATDPAVHAAVDQLWPVLSPQRLLADLFADPALLATAAAPLSPAQRALLHRAPGGFSPADVPLLDEAAELLGEDHRAARDLARRQGQARRAYAEGLLAVLGGSEATDREDAIEQEGVLATDLLDAEALGERYADRERLTAAQRAAADRRWAYGHIIVDEAQELSQMAWRLLMRRSPNRSMTVVGDVAQTGELAGAGSWAEVFDRYAPGRWRGAELTVNYRTPAEVMAVADRVLAGIDPDRRPPRSVRATGVPPWATRGERLPDLVVAAVQAELAELGEGRLGVLVAPEDAAAVGSAVRAAVPDAALGADPDLTAPVAVLTVRQAKGLEFDVVLVAEPAAIMAGSRRGRNDLYVALTRATQRLRVLHTGPLPAELADLPDRRTAAD